MFLYILLLSLLTASFLSVTYFILTLLFGVVWYVLYAFGAYRLFQKAGITGWLAWIPIVNEYFTYKIAWNSEAFIIEAFVTLLQVLETAVEIKHLSQFFSHLLL